MRLVDTLIKVSPLLATDEMRSGFPLGCCDIVGTSLLRVIACMIFVVLAGCEQPRKQISYESLCGLTKDQMGSLDEDGVREWIEKEHGPVQEVILDQALDEEYSGSITAYGWSEMGKVAGIAYMREGRLYRASVYDLENGPNFGQVVTSLGVPQAVFGSGTTLQDPVLYTIRMEYPDLGLSVEGSSLEARSELIRGEGLSAPLREKMLVRNVECYVPGSIEEVLRNVFLLSPEVIRYQLEKRIKWPGFSSIVPLQDAP
jgi:hypothetical protein